VSYSDEIGAFIDTIDDLNEYLKQIAPRPKENLDFVKTVKFLTDPIESTPDSKETVKDVNLEEASFPHEYAVSGWFRWKSIPNQQAWHIVFNLGSIEPKNYGNSVNLGDLDLGVWVGSSNFLQFQTYNYANMQGAGQANVQ
jgi:hypothetical protein